MRIHAVSHLELLAQIRQPQAQLAPAGGVTSLSSLTRGKSFHDNQAPPTSVLGILPGAPVASHAMPNEGVTLTPEEVGMLTKTRVLCNYYANE